MTNKPSAGPFQHLLLPLFLLFCFGGVFYTYYKPAVSWLACPNVPLATHGVCTEECISVLMENFTQGVNTTSSPKKALVQQQSLITQSAVNGEHEENHDSDIIMLMWYWPFGYKFDVNACGPKFGIKGCQITDDRSLFDKAHGVMVHHRDIVDDIRDLLNRRRPLHQKWVWMNMESPDNSGRHDDIDDAFNLTSSYRRDSDVWVPYGRMSEAPEKERNVTIPPKNKLVCWIVSNWNPRFRRVQFFNELTKYIKVEAYGRHFSRYINNDEYINTVSSCKFYLSFENSLHKDYFTEKLFNPMKMGTVPVVLGPSRENYEEFIPADSFIHVDDFKSPEELAKHLTFLDQNQEEYERYLSWRKHFAVESTYFGLENVCRSCDYIRNYKGYRVFKNINRWYWG